MLQEWVLAGPDGCITNLLSAQEVTGALVECALNFAGAGIPELSYATEMVCIIHLETENFEALSPFLGSEKGLGGDWIF